MRESHDDQIERWAKFVRENPTKWKKIHTEFIDAIFAKNREVMQRLKETPEGEEKIRLLKTKED
jgi:hypothetical protein